LTDSQAGNLRVFLGGIDEILHTLSLLILQQTDKSNGSVESESKLLRLLSLNERLLTLQAKYEFLDMDANVDATKQAVRGIDNTTYNGNTKSSVTKYQDEDEDDDDDDSDLYLFDQRDQGLGYASSTTTTTTTTTMVVNDGDSANGNGRGGRGSGTCLSCESDDVELINFTNCSCSAYCLEVQRINASIAIGSDQS
jgi:hypothetical protein